jgi:signal transduction histidine kinase
LKLSNQIILAFAAVILLSVADSYTNYLLSIKVRRNTEFLSKSEMVIRNSNRTHKAIIDMQSSFRGYLLTNDTTFLLAYDNGKRNVPILLEQQRNLVLGHDVQVKLLDSIASLHTHWVDYSGQLITARRRVPGSEAYRQLFEGRLKKQVGKKMNDAIAVKFARLDKIEYRIRKQHGAQLQRSIDTTHAFSVVFLSLTILVGIVSTAYIVMLISKRIASMVRLAEKISKGDFSIVDDRRNDELTALSRSLNIMSRKLDQNIRELENRNAELNKFAYVVSHDLKAPLRGIHNVITWIEEDFRGEISPQMKKHLDIIPQRTRRMEALINGLLDYARINQRSPRDEVDLNALVRDIAQLIVPKSFAVRIAELPVFYAERLKLEQVFANLISNAVKYAHRPDGHIKIGCREHHDHYEFSVADNGIGIAPEYHDKIFEIFQTLRERYEKESTGIGLAIVKKIIEEQHGRISVRSVPGQGAEFIFTWKKINR